MPWPSLASYTISPPIFADLVLDTSGGLLVLNVERHGWLEKVQELYPLARRAGLMMRDSGEVAAWLDTNGQPFECFSRVTGRISLDGHTQERRACIRCDGTEVWVDSDGNTVMED